MHRSVHYRIKESLLIVKNTWNRGACVVYQQEIVKLEIVSVYTTNCNQIQCKCSATSVQKLSLTFQFTSMLMYPSSFVTLSVVTTNPPVSDPSSAFPRAPKTIIEYGFTALLTKTNTYLNKHTCTCCLCGST